MLLQLLVQMIQINLNLVKLLIFTLLLHVEGFHFTFYDVSDFEIKRHVVIMNTVQNNWVRYNLTRSIIITTFSHFLYILFDVILNDLDPLYNDIFKNPLSLLQIELGLVCVFIGSSIELLLKLEVHFIFAINNTVDIAKSSS